MQRSNQAQKQEQLIFPNFTYNIGALSHPGSHPEAPPRPITNLATMGSTKINPMFHTVYYNSIRDNRAIGFNAQLV